MNNYPLDEQLPLIIYERKLRIVYISSIISVENMIKRSKYIDKT